jgi:hypothetical protein
MQMAAEEEYMRNFYAEAEAQRRAELSSDSEDEGDQKSQMTDLSKLTPAERARRSLRSGLDADAIIGKNPVPPEGRGVMMFTEDYFGQGGHYEGTVGRKIRTTDPYQKEFNKELKVDNQTLLITDTPHAFDNPRRRGEAKKPKGVIPPVQLSGWIFVSLARMSDASPP